MLRTAGHAATEARPESLPGVLQRQQPQMLAQPLHLLQLPVCEGSQSRRLVL
jgi:hypothetical protein